MMTDVISVASARLHHWWELQGLTNPTRAIRRIAEEMAPTPPQVRAALEAHLHDEWARLCAREGDDYV